MLEDYGGVCGKIVENRLGRCGIEGGRVGISYGLDDVDVVEGVGVDVERGGLVKRKAESD